MKDQRENEVSDTGVDYKAMPSPNGLIVFLRVPLPEEIEDGTTHVLHGLSLGTALRLFDELGEAITTKSEDCDPSKPACENGKPCPFKPQPCRWGRCPIVFV